MEYVNVDKLRPDYGGTIEPSGDHNLSIWFLTEHQGCNITPLGEYGETHDEWLDTLASDAWKEVTYNKHGEQ